MAGLWTYFYADQAFRLWNFSYMRLENDMKVINLVSMNIAVKFFQCNIWKR